MKLQTVFAIILIVVVITSFTLMKRKFSNVVRPLKIRVDKRGNGYFDANRTGYKHEGIDLLVSVGQTIYAPFGGTITRRFLVYAGDANYTGVELVSTDQTRRAKLMYMDSTLIGQKVRAGQAIGTAQQISKKYGGATSGMLDHLHFELRENGVLVNPISYFSNLA